MIKGFENTPEIIRPVLREIWTNIINSVDPYKCVRENLIEDNGDVYIAGRRFKENEYRRIFLTGIGKAVQPMATATIDVMGEFIHSGFLVGKHLGDEFLNYLPTSITACNGSHPIPDENSIKSAAGMVDFLDQTTEGDLVINLISGGGSALMTYPFVGITLKDMQTVTALLLASGASIYEFNTIRKHLDQIKGGGMARYAHPAGVESLILSDVIGNDISMIASGPTSVDPTTFSDALNVLRKFQIFDACPNSIRTHLLKGENGEIPETLKGGEKIIENISNMIISSSDSAIDSASSTATRLGFRTEIISRSLEGEARNVGTQLGKFLREECKKTSDSPLCLIAGGETTVTVTGNGLGGRNQEFALSAAFEIDGYENCYLISIATDGEDGPTDCAGAWVDGETISSAKDQGLNPVQALENNDSYHLLDAVGSLIRTGPTGTNVNDVVLLLIL